MFELRLFHQQHFVDQFGDDLPRELAGRLDRNAFGQRVTAARPLVDRHRRVHRREQFGLHSDHLDLRLHCLGYGGHAAHQPAATDRHDQAVEIVLLGEHLERHRALPRRNQRVVERVDEGQPALLFEFTRMRIGFVESLAMEDDLPANAFGLHHLHARGGLRHHDRDRDPQPSAVIAEPLRVVAGRGCNYAARLLLVAQVEQGVERAALLVSGSELVVLELEPDVRPRNLRQRL